MHVHFARKATLDRGALHVRGRCPVIQKEADRPTIERANEVGGEGGCEHVVCAMSNRGDGRFCLSWCVSNTESHDTCCKCYAYGEEACTFSVVAPIYGEVRLVQKQAQRCAGGGPQFTYTFVEAYESV